MKSAHFAFIYKSICSALILACSSMVLAQAPETSTAAKPADTSSKKLSCESLKQTIDDKLVAKGVKNYQLDIVAAGESTSGKVVGQCDGGKNKIVYVKESK